MQPNEQATAATAEKQTTKTQEAGTPAGFDVIVSGGGLAGLLTAIGLRRECPQLHIAIIDANANNANHVRQSSQDSHGQNATSQDGGGQNRSDVHLSPDKFDGRHIALSYGSLQLLEHWQVWQDLKPLAAPIKTIITSDRGHAGKTILKAPDFDLNAMGYVADMRNIGSVFNAKLDEIAGNNIKWFPGAEISQLTVAQNTTSEPQSITATLSTGQQLQASLLVVAEGGRSNTKTLLGVGNEQDDYQQTAIVTNIKTRGATKKLAKLLRHPRLETKDFVDCVAFERFTTNGPIAFLPIGNQQYSVVWTMLPEEAEQTMAMADDEFCQALQGAFGFGAGEITAVSQRWSFPLYFSKAQQLIHNRVAILGNAAHTVHPIAGQGFNLGLRDIAVLVNEVKNSLAASDKQADKGRCDRSVIGDFATLNRYQQNRFDDINRITTFTDSLVRVFGLEGRLAAFCRTSGLMALQKFDPLQTWLAKHFMGSQAAKNLPQTMQYKD